MKERQDKRGGAGVAILCGIILFLLPVLYVLSVGPAAWLVSSNNRPIWWIEAFYFPLGLLGQYCEPFASFLGWYIELWH